MKFRSSVLRAQILASAGLRSTAAAAVHSMLTHTDILCQCCEQSSQLLRLSVGSSCRPVLWLGCQLVRRRPPASSSRDCRAGRVSGT
eukprot:2008000-Rhodomonas_salina.3